MTTTDGAQHVAGRRRVRPLAALLSLVLAAQLVVVATGVAEAPDGVDLTAQPAPATTAAPATAPGEPPAPAPAPDPAPTTTPGPTAPPATVPSTPTPTVVEAAASTGLGATPSPTTTLPSLEGGDPCGPVRRKPDGTLWRCSFADNFDGTTLDRSKWGPQLTSVTGFRVGPECYVDHPDNISVADGTLRLTARQVPYFVCKSNNPKGKKDFGTRYTSGMVTTFGKWSQTFGKFEVRAKLPATKVPGVAVAFWLWPDDPFYYGPWPGSGEIDFMEWFSRYPELIQPHVHYYDDGSLPDGRQQAHTTYGCAYPDVEDWHVYGLQWTFGKLVFTVDGRHCMTTHYRGLLLPPGAPFDRPFNLSLTQALGGPSNNPFTAATPMPNTTTVDWVRVWR